MSRSIELGAILQGPSGQRWKVVRRAEDNVSRGILKVMITLRAAGQEHSRREISRSERHLLSSLDAGLWRLLPARDDTLLEILEPGDA